MSAAAPPAGPLPAGTDAGGRLRLGAYLAALLAALLVTGARDLRGPLALGGLALAALALLAALVLPRRGLAAVRLATLGASLAGALAFGPPLLLAFSGGEGMAGAARQTSLWPEILVLLFASRVLAELSDARFALFWRDPLAPSGRGRSQSVGAALLGGLCLTLLFYHSIAALRVEPAALDPGSIVLRALTGTTAIHLAILVLFFTVLAALADAGLRQMEDEAVLAALRRLSREEAAAGRLTGGRRALARLAEARLPAFSHSRALQGLLAACGAPAAPEAARQTLGAIHAASRRLLRALLSFLPLLGFLGTVIGLTAAIGGLPADLGPEAGARLDIGASLLGLAVKFETTLLGLLGGLVGALLLALLEAREAELAAECRRLAEVAGDG